jgi:hypothetical protein
VKESRIRIDMVPRKEPDLGLYVQALIAVARQAAQNKSRPAERPSETTAAEEVPS